MWQRNGKGPMMIVLAPTRELACQILDETQKFGRPNGIRSVCCYGGAPKYPQIAALDRGVECVIATPGRINEIAALDRGVECVIATPGRINDLIEMKKVDLSSVRFVVLDEADRMLDMGFEPQIRSIMSQVRDNHNRQTLLFSATWPKEIQKLAFDFLLDPIKINVGEINVLNANKDITQKIIMCSDGDKNHKIKEILKNLVGDADQTEGSKVKPSVDLGGKKHSKVIIFVAKKYMAHELANQLWEDGFAVDSLHGDRAQWERTKVIGAFKQGTLRLLVATDVAARGLDVKDVGVVVNYDMPAGTNGAEDYIHRIGRTGRAGAKGIAYTFFTQGVGSWRQTSSVY
jgi:ATP-dependent RNA helicase DDX5/DBP2